jgi:3-methylfumaryl-CoA hydratase
MVSSILEVPVKSTEICTLTMVRRVAAMLDLDTSTFSEGDILPKGWHFFMLAGETRKSELRKDGFPGLGVSMPDFQLPRLLLGGRTVAYRGEITIGSEVERTSFVKEIKEKTTNNGPMAIVTIQHELRPIAQEQSAIVETQTYILLESKTAPPQPSATAAASIGSELNIVGAKQFIPDETLLFQYSALGFNSHKIHFDRDYARNVEGLPDLVVNGGLATLLMTEFIRNDMKLDLTEIEVKHVAPLYCNRSLTIVLEDDYLKIYNENNEVAVTMAHR